MQRRRRGGCTSGQQEQQREGDARARLVRVTAKGRKLVEISRPVVREIESTWERHLGRARARQLRSALRALREITDPFAGPPERGTAAD